jgi:hypothetical protein
VKNSTNKEEVEIFRVEIYGENVEHNEEVCWIKDPNQRNSSMEWSPVYGKEVVKGLRKTLNCKAPGRDQKPNFWLKQLTATHKYIAAIFNKLIEEDPVPEWLTAEVTFLIPKNENSENTKNYRSVTCLPSIYKLITFIIISRMQKYMDYEKLLPK